MNVGAKPIVDLDGLINNLESSKKWWRSDDDNLKNIGAAASALTGALDGADITPEMKLKAWTALKAVEDWTTPSTVTRVFGGFVHVFTEPEVDKWAEIRTQVKNASDNLACELTPTESEKFDRVFKRVIPLTAGTRAQKDMVKLFYRSVQIPTEGKTIAYKHGSTESSKAFIDAINNRDERAVKLLLLDGAGRHWSGPRLSMALQDAMQSMTDVSNPQYKFDTVDWENSWKIIEALVDAGAPLDTPPREYMSGSPGSLLQLASFAGRTGLVRKLVDRGAPWATKYRDPDTRKLVGEVREIDLKENDQKIARFRGNASDRDVAKSLISVIERKEIVRAMAAKKKWGPSADDVQLGDKLDYVYKNGLTGIKAVENLLSGQRVDVYYPFLQPYEQAIGDLRRGEVVVEEAKPEAVVKAPPMPDQAFETGEELLDALRAAAVAGKDLRGSLIEYVHPDEEYNVTFRITVYVSAGGPNNSPELIFGSSDTTNRYAFGDADINQEITLDLDVFTRATDVVLKPAWNR